MKAYLDTSVLVSYYTPEPRRCAVVEHLRQITEPTISLLCEAEFHSAIARKRKTGEAGATIGRALDLLHRHRRAGLYHVIALEQPHFAKAMHLLDTVTVALRTLDALHLSIAVLEGIDLITADRCLSDAAEEIAHPCVFIT
ncbi:MAG: type II toxin-antitoxin system VapC family toxin [Nitrococcus sp.]|nr:type II toxin-antitoxin system VapC family toxin [Nitrococcus sp.]